MFQIKKKWFNHILKYKIQYIAYRYKEEKKIDYVEIFMVIIKLMSYKKFFIIKVKYNYWICHINIIKAFLYSFFNEIIYMKQPQFFITKSNIVCKLIKVLYKQKQALYIW